MYRNVQSQSPNVVPFFVIHISINGYNPTRVLLQRVLVCSKSLFDPGDYDSVAFDIDMHLVDPVSNI